MLELMQVLWMQIFLDMIVIALGGDNLVVAEGQIASRGPKSKVHHVTLGLMCWKVWVSHVIVNVSLFRSTHEMYNLQDAIGSIVAWLSQFILSD
ncbi:hypothetical protein CsSME_00031508 [Camellia sinensis var. sinensis]